MEALASHLTVSEGHVQPFAMRTQGDVEARVRRRHCCSELLRGHRRDYTVKAGPTLTDAAQLRNTVMTMSEPCSAPFSRIIPAQETLNSFLRGSLLLPDAVDGTRRSRQSDGKCLNLLFQGQETSISLFNILGLPNLMEWSTLLPPL